MLARVRKIFASIGLVVGLALSGGTVHAVLYEELFVFGDSLSDGGNMFALTITR